MRMSSGNSILALETVEVWQVLYAVLFLASKERHIRDPIQEFFGNSASLHPGIGLLLFLASSSVSIRLLLILILSIFPNFLPIHYRHACAGSYRINILSPLRPLQECCSHSTIDRNEDQGNSYTLIINKAGAVY